MALIAKSALLGTCLFAVGFAAYSPDDPTTAEDSAPTAADAPRDQQTDQPAKKTVPPAAQIQELPTPVNLSRAAEKKIRKAMQTKIDITLKDTELEKFVEILAKKGKLPIWLNETALNEEGIGIDEPLTAELHGVTIEQALNWTLPSLGLTWVIGDELLKVTTEIEAEEWLFTRTYNVASLLGRKQADEQTKVSRSVGIGLRPDPPSMARTGTPQRAFPTTGRLPSFVQSAPNADRFRPTTELMQFGGGLGSGTGTPIGWPPEPDDDDWLIELIASVTSGPWWDIDGTGGNMHILHDVLIVRQTSKVQEEIKNLLAALNAVAAGNANGGSIVSRPETYPVDEDQKIQKVLREKISVKYVNTPLSSVVADLANQHKIHIRLETTALEEEGIANDEPITLTLNQVSVGSILYVLLEPVGLTWYVSDGALVITTEIEAEEILYTAVYAVRDLAGPEKDYESLVEVLQSETSGPWQAVDGTGGTVIPADLLGALAIQQTHKVHREIKQLLADMRTTIAAQLKTKPSPKPDPNKLITRIYDLSKMNAAADLLTAIPKFIAPDTWDVKNKSIVIQKVGESLVIRQSRTVHEKIDRFLQRLGYYTRAGNGAGYF